MRKSAWVLVFSVSSACARLTEQTSLRAVPLEAPRTVLQPLGDRLAIAGVRQGAVVRAHVRTLHTCADVQEQRAEGFRRVERHADGPSLTLEWLFGGLFTAGGAGLVAWTAASPVDASAGVDNATSNYVYGAAISAIGLGLLAGALYDHSLTGVHETSLGVQTLRKPGPERVCAEAPASAGQVRLTLADGTQLEAGIDASGEATIPLPADLETRLLREGSRRATLEALGDAKAQVRIEL